MAPQSREVSVVIPILQVGKLKLREAQSPAGRNPVSWLDVLNLLILILPRSLLSGLFPAGVRSCWKKDFSSKVISFLFSLKSGKP